MNIEKLQCPKCDNFAIGVELKPESRIFCVLGHYWSPEQSLKWVADGVSQLKPARYWKERCLLAEEYIACESDPHLKAYDKWQEKINEN